MMMTRITNDKNQQPDTWTAITPAATRTTTIAAAAAATTARTETAITYRITKWRRYTQQWHWLPW